MTVFLCINPTKAQDVACFGEVESWFRSTFTIAGSVEKADVIITLGGDGTLIYAMGMYGPAYRYLGVNVGHLGFLTTAERDNYQTVCTDILKNGNSIEEKLFYITYGYRNEVGRAINDVVIKGESISKAVHLDISVNGQSLYRHIGDGVILSTPAGSTAYNLSIGGCIVHPATKAFILNNIAPHLLSVRPLVMNETDTVTVAPVSTGAMLVIDGREAVPFHEPIDISLSKDSIPLLRPKDWRFYDLLRRKMSWGSRNGYTP